MRNRRHRTIVDVLRYRASMTPSDPAYIFLGDGDFKSDQITYQELDMRSQEIACSLLERCGPGDRALLLYPSCLEFISSFFGCLKAGVVPLALYPPNNSDRQAKRIFGRMLQIVADASPSIAVTTSAILPTATAQLDRIDGMPQMQWFSTGDLVPADSTACLPPPQPDQTAFLQYTSGSTSEPRGVLVTHENLMFNERMVFLGGENREGSMSVSWLPVFHDMGLIAAMLQALYAGMGCVLLSPIHFIKHPNRWLQAISDYQAVYSGAPNFAYELCARKVTPEEKQTLDLSSWELAFSSSEPVLAETLDRFCSAFKHVGFSRRAFFPAYGLAEATVFVTGGRRGVEPIVKTFSRAGLSEGQARPPQDDGLDSLSLVSSGATLLDQRIAIVDTHTSRRLPSLEIGEIWVAGNNVSPGYWRSEEATEEIFGAGIEGEANRRWLRTGDLGFVEDGDLFVTGRLKDLIIVAGRNHYPQDMERTIEACHPAIRPGCCAVFGRHHDSEEVVVAAVEIRFPRDVDFQDQPHEIKRAVTVAVAVEHDIRLFDVCLLEPTTIPKTSSGKVQRHLCREIYENGRFQCWPPGFGTRLHPASNEGENTMQDHDHE